MYKVVIIIQKNYERGRKCILIGNQNLSKLDRGNKASTMLEHEQLSGVKDKKFRLVVGPN
jgi:hypothetical protein